jgi:hypothetical protein
MVGTGETGTSLERENSGFSVSHGCHATEDQEWFFSMLHQWLAHQMLYAWEPTKAFWSACGVQQAGTLKKPLPPSQ